MFLIRLLFPALLAVACAVPAHALTVDGVTFDDRIRLAGSELQLNGVGFRAVAWLKGYAAGLYLGQKAATVPQVLAAAGPKRIQMRMLVDVDTEEFVKAFNKGIARNTPVAEHPVLAERMRQFDRMVRDVRRVKKGDVIDLDWLPGRGLVLSINGRPRGDAIPGEDLYAALLRIWLGERPVDAALKNGLLGAPASSRPVTPSPS